MQSQCLYERVEWIDNNQGRRQYEDGAERSEAVGFEDRSDTGASQGTPAPLEAERGQACVLPRASGGSSALLAPWIQPTETISDFCSLEWWENKLLFFFFKAKVCINFVTATKEMNTQATYVEAIKD